jgi:hypothetical protein
MIKYIIAAIAGVVAGVVVTLYVLDFDTAPEDGGTPSGSELDSRASVDALIEGLRLLDPEDRALFHKNLLEETGMFFGFKPTALHEEREAAVRRWEKWWAANRDKTKEQWLIESLSMKNYDGKPLALRELAEMSSQASVPEIIPLLADEDSEVRREAALALGQLHAGAAVEKLSEMLLGEEDFHVTRAAARALGQIGSEECLEALAKTGEHKDILTRLEAVSSLMLRDADRALPLLYLLLKENHEQARQFAMTQLVCLRRAESVPHLAELLVSEDPWIDKAREALTKIVGKDLGPERDPWIEWYENNKNQAEHNPM